MSPLCNHSGKLPFTLAFMQNVFLPLAVCELGFNATADISVDQFCHPDLTGGLCDRIQWEASSIL